MVFLGWVFFGWFFWRGFFRLGCFGRAFFRWPSSSLGLGGILRLHLWLWFWLLDGLWCLRSELWLGRLHASLLCGRVQDHRFCGLPALANFFLGGVERRVRGAVVQVHGGARLLGVFLDGLHGRLFFERLGGGLGVRLHLGQNHVVVVVIFFIFVHATVILVVRHAMVPRIGIIGLERIEILGPSGIFERRYVLRLA